MLKSAMLTRVGAEPMGRFVRTALAGYGVDVSHVVDDPKHLTALVILGGGSPATDLIELFTPPPPEE